MSPIILYILKANLAISLLYLLYVALLKRDTFFSLRRYFLLFSIVFSLILPLISVSSLGSLWLSSHSGKSADVEVSVLVEEPTIAMIVDEAGNVGSVINWHSIAFFSVIAVCIFLLFRFIVQLISIYGIWRRSNKKKLLGVDVCIVERDINPFSFFNLIFINDNRHTYEELKQIILHERTHAEQLHSIDNIIITVINILFWWNPFVWLIKREMILNLEHLADSKVIDRGIDISEYQYHLVKLTYHETAAHLVNNFNVSQLKQRIIMMNKSKTPALKLAKYLSIIPLLLLLISVNSIYAAQNVVEMNENDIIDTELQDPPPVKKDNDEVFIVVEEMPTFPGGNDALMKYLGDNIKYPISAQTKGIQGRVICSMIINKDGSISDVVVARGVDPSLDKEAVRVIESMPNWTPGKQRGNIVKVKYTLPIVYKLSTSDDNDTKPEFPGGNDALMKFLANTIKYPVIAQENEVQDLIKVICSIDENGKAEVSNISGNDILVKEVKRVIASMPQWKPATSNGKTTRSTYMTSFVFRLQGDEGSNFKSYDGEVPEDAIVVVGYAKQK